MTEIEYFELVPVAEITQPVAPGTAPDAPGGRDYVDEDDEETRKDPDDDSGVWRDPDGNTDGFEVPKKDDDLL